jgi:hypothetical protein
LQQRKRSVQANALWEQNKIAANVGNIFMKLILRFENSLEAMEEYQYHMFCIIFGDVVVSSPHSRLHQTLEQAPLSPPVIIVT